MHADQLDGGPVNVNFDPARHEADPFRGSLAGQASIGADRYLEKMTTPNSPRLCG
jgi:hypothetical protein